MGRGKVELKKIENRTKRQITFSKRRGGLLKKAHELATLCDAQIGLVIFSSSGKLFEYSSPFSNIPQFFEKYQKHTNTFVDVICSNQQQIYGEMMRMRSEYERLQATMLQYTGQNLIGITVNDLNQLEEQLMMSVNKVQMRKDQIMHQQLENLRQKEDEHSYLRALAEQQQQQLEVTLQMSAEHNVEEVPKMEFLPRFYVEEQQGQLLSLSPQLHEFRLMPTQPNLHEASLIGHGLQLWKETRAPGWQQKGKQVTEDL